MALLKKLLNKFNGLHYPQEYLCLAKESFQQPIHAYLVNDKGVIKDITDQHLFTGYSPLILTLNSPTDQKLPDEIDIAFSQKSLQPNDFFKQKDAIASLSSKMIRKQAAGDTIVFYYEGIKGKHHFLSSFHQYIVGLNNNLYNKKRGNVFLNNNLYKQVQIAYAVPRIISLITVSDGKLFNLFPTDLHGPVGEQYYVSSLRHEGKASRQVEAAGRIAISQIDYRFYKTVYSLGKNHMQELKPRKSFPFSDSDSSIFKLPLPRETLYYHELELMESFVHGLHKLFLFKIASGKAIKDERATLAHIHNTYATWRHNKRLPGNYLLR
jgi:flavin reductase (DIM6/NTAB) family NADH-FMN oxidoreductase RutF